MKNKNPRAGFKRSETHSQQKKTTPTVNHRRTVIKYYAGIIGIFILLFITPSSTSVRSEVKEIIKTATKLCKFIPDDAPNKNAIVGALEQMVILKLSPGNLISIPSGVRFAVVIVPKDKMSTPEDKAKGGTIVMRFNREQLEKFGNIVIEVNQDIYNISNDMHCKAATLIHELFHGLQLVKHLNEKTPITTAQAYQDELEAWGIHAFLYKNARPDMFEGLEYNCQTEVFFPVNKVQRKALDPDNGDLAVRNLLMFAFCGNNYLRNLYPQ